MFQQKMSKKFENKGDAIINLDRHFSAKKFENLTHDEYFY